MYLSNWKQKDFENFKKNFQKYLMFIMLKNYQKLISNKKKLKLVFCLQTFINLIQLLILLKI